MRDGYLNKCKDCAKTDSLENRKKNIENIRAYDRQRGSRQSSGYLKKWRGLNKNKSWAHNRVAKALKSGIIKKPLACEKCLIVKKLVAHHGDYLKPLEVNWLCQACHKQWHIENGEGKNGNTSRESI